MSFTFVKQLPSPDQIKSQTPLSEEMKKIKAKRDRLIQDVITGRSDKFLVIIGPCSADNEDSVCEYTNRLAKIQDKVADRLVLVPRIYTNKPRTTGEGYKGMLHQPDPEAKPDVMAGILAIRHMHMRSIAETGLTSADEMLYPDNWHYLSDLLSYVAIGARSVENQEHRLMVSGLDIPAGVNKIDDQALYNCQSVMDITLPEGLLYLGKECLYSCGFNYGPQLEGEWGYSKKKLSIPASVNQIDDGGYGIFAQYPKAQELFGVFEYKLILQVKKGSIAHRYAAKKKIRFELV